MISAAVIPAVIKCEPCKALGPDALETLKKTNANLSAVKKRDLALSGW